MNGGLSGRPAPRAPSSARSPRSRAWMGLGIAAMTPNHVPGATWLRQAPAAPPASAPDRVVRRVRQYAAVGRAARARHAPTAPKPSPALRALPAAEVQQKVRGHGMIVDGKIITEDLSITFAEGRAEPGRRAGRLERRRRLVPRRGRRRPPKAGAAARRSAGARRPSLASLPTRPRPTPRRRRKAVQPFTDTLSWHMRLVRRGAGEDRPAVVAPFLHLRSAVRSGQARSSARRTPARSSTCSTTCAPRAPSRRIVGRAQRDVPQPARGGLSDQVSQYFVNFARTATLTARACRAGRR